MVADFVYTLNTGLITVIGVDKCAASLATASIKRFSNLMNMFVGWGTLTLTIVVGWRVDGLLNVYQMSYCCVYICFCFAVRMYAGKV